MITMLSIVANLRPWKEGVEVDNRSTTTMRCQWCLLIQHLLPLKFDDLILEPALRSIPYTAPCL